MSQDFSDLLKVLVATALVFTLGTLAMLYLLFLLAEYGSDLPLLSTLPRGQLPDLVPLLGEARLFTTLAAAHVTAMGLALIITSNTVDKALLITSKAVAVVIMALLGFVGGQFAYLQLQTGAGFALSPLTPMVIALAGFLLLSTVLSVQRLRLFGNLRFVAALILLLAGPLLLILL